MGYGERRWFVLERPRRDTNGGIETEVTVTSKPQATWVMMMSYPGPEGVLKRERRWVLAMMF